MEREELTLGPKNPTDGISHSWPSSHIVLQFQRVWDTIVMQLRACRCLGMSWSKVAPMAEWSVSQHERTCRANSADDADIWNLEGKLEALTPDLDGIKCQQLRRHTAFELLCIDSITESLPESPKDIPPCLSSNPPPSQPPSSADFASCPRPPVSAFLLYSSAPCQSEMPGPA